MPLTCAVGRASAETVAGVPEAPAGAGSSAAAGAAGASAIAPRGTRTAAKRPLRSRRGSFTGIPFRTYSDHGHATLHMVDTPCPTRGAGLAHSTPKTTCLPRPWRFPQPRISFLQHRPFGRIMRLRRYTEQIAASVGPGRPTPPFPVSIIWVRPRHDPGQHHNEATIRPLEHAEALPVTRLRENDGQRLNGAIRRGLEAQPAAPRNVAAL